jgi:hypothetical protein
MPAALWGQYEALMTRLGAKARDGERELELA